MIFLYHLKSLFFIHPDSVHFTGICMHFLNYMDVHMHEYLLVHVHIGVEVKVQP